MEIRTSGSREVGGTAQPPGKARARKKPGRGQGLLPTVRIRGTAARVVGRLAMFFLLAVLVCALAVCAFTSDAFRLREVTVNGCRHQDAEKLKRVVRGMRYSANILFVDLGETRRRLEQERWVDHVELHRVLPSRLVVDVTERTPKAVVELAGEQMVADGEGVLLGAYGSGFGKVESPIFKGLMLMADEQDLYKAYGVYQEENAGLVRRGLALLSKIERTTPEAARKISEIDLSERKYVKILMDDSPVVICLGEGEDDIKRFRTLIVDATRLQRELKAKKGADMDQMKQINLRNKGSIVYTPRDGVKPPAEAQGAGGSKT